MLLLARVFIVPAVKPRVLGVAVLGGGVGRRAALARVAPAAEGELRRAETTARSALAAEEDRTCVGSESWAARANASAAARALAVLGSTALPPAPPLRLGEASCARARGDITEDARLTRGGDTMEALKAAARARASVTVSPPVGLLLGVGADPAAAAAFTRVVEDLFVGDTRAAAAAVAATEAATLAARAAK